MESLIAAAAELADARVEKVQFSGGEPLLRAGFLDILDAIDPERVRVHVASNGYRLNDEMLSRLKQARLAKLSVSVDGGIAAHHDQLRRKRGAFERTMDGIERAVQAGLLVGVSATVTPGNISSVETLVERLVDVGVTDISFHSVVSVGRAESHPELLFAPEAEDDFRRTIERVQGAYGNRITLENSFDANGVRSVHGCPAQDRLLHIDPSGDVSPCSWLYKLDPTRFTLGNISERSLRSIADSYCERLDALRAVEPDHCIIPLTFRESGP